MTNTELQVFRDAYRFFAAHSDPPKTDAAAWWVEVARKMGAFSTRWQHPLMNGLLAAVYEYLEQKAKEADT